MLRQGSTRPRIPTRVWLIITKASATAPVRTSGRMSGAGEGHLPVGEVEVGVEARDEAAGVEVGEVAAGAGEAWSGVAPAVACECTAMRTRPMRAAIKSGHCGQDVG